MDRVDGPNPSSLLKIDQETEKHKAGSGLTPMTPNPACVQELVDEGSDKQKGLTPKGLGFRV